MRLLAGVIFAAMFAASAQAQPDAWKKLEFLTGKWIGSAGEKDTSLGAGQGAFSFEPELKGKIIVRRNNASYNSGVTHDDLMVIYLEGETPHAIYWDSEGHVIRYGLSFPAEHNVVFESEAGQPGPKYRLSYWMDGREMKGKFEVGGPGGEYKTYMSWSSKKQS
jgi:hypothetical protein